jgi:Rrf2 family transcriptional regulator, nitric oxide-sensitive transcriptional repressor
MLSRTAEYAVRAVACLAGNLECPMSADALAERTQVPRRYLHKVLQDLVQAELVQSRSGPGGGYSLLPLPDDISILDVVNAVAPLERIRHCPLGLPTHTRLCPVHQELDRAYAATEAAFARVTLGELLRSNSDITPLCEMSRQ